MTLPHESALILAGAGSGKTRVLTTRIVWLIQTGQVSPHGMLAVTFTNKAAKEMLTRISAMLPINTRGMWVGTFHGLANRLLRTHYREAGLPQSFQILDSADQLSAIKRLMKAMNVDTEKYEPKKVQWFINGHKEAGLRARDVEAFDEYSMRMAELYEAYDAQCQREGVADFPELLLRSYELLYRNEPLRQHYQDRFRHILIDEFQDTNTLQYRWLKLFAGPHTALFAVGDDDQSIYAFRGANTANMAEFEREFAHGNVIKLEQNYRSHGHILTAANTLIAQNAHRLGKNLWTAEGEGEPIRMFDAYSDQDEASFVVDEAKALNREGVDVLRHGAAVPLQRAVAGAGTCAVFGGRAVSRVRRTALLRAPGNQARAGLSAPADQSGRRRRVPARGQLPHPRHRRAHAGTVVRSAARSGTSLWQAACTSGGKVAGFARLIEAIKQATARSAAARGHRPCHRSSGLARLLPRRQGRRRPPGKPQRTGQRRRAVCGRIRGRRRTRYSVKREWLLCARCFLAHAALEAGEHQAGVGHDALQLMTVHAAKGLEFHAVFITGLEEGLFPHEQSANEENGLEEERRLMYVAITRARRRLYLSHAQSRMLHGQMRYSMPSRFLERAAGAGAAAPQSPHRPRLSSAGQQRPPRASTPAQATTPATASARAWPTPNSAPASSSTSRGAAAMRGCR